MNPKIFSVKKKTVNLDNDYYNMSMRWIKSFVGVLSSIFRDVCAHIHSHIIAHVHIYIYKYIEIFIDGLYIADKIYPRIYVYSINAM